MLLGQSSRIIDRLRLIRAEQTDALYQGAAIGLAASWIAGVLLGLFLIHNENVSATAMMIWMAVLTAHRLWQPDEGKEITTIKADQFWNSERQ